MYLFFFVFSPGSPAGYKIQMWVEDEGESTMEEQVFPFNIAEGSVTLLKPYSSMVLQVRIGYLTQTLLQHGLAGKTYIVRYKHHRH